MTAAAGAFRITDARGRWARGLAWRVTTPAGEPHDLSSLQEALRRAITWQIGHGRHRLTLADLAELVGAEHRGSVWHALGRLRSLSLVAYRAPLRGRTGTFAFWIPRLGAARLAARTRAATWPTRAGWTPDRPGRGDPSANVVTPTTFGGNLTREGIRRAWRGRQDSGGGPPIPLAPRRGAAGRPFRARRRPWPPRYVDETCPSRSHRVRLELARSVTDSPGDVGAVWTGRCRRDRHALAVGLVLVVEPTGGPELAGAVAGRIAVRPGDDPTMAAAPATVGTSDPAGTPLPHRRELAVAFLADGVDDRLADRLRVDHLGYRRRPLYHPAERPRMAAAPGGLAPDELAAVAWSEIVADLELVRDSRRLELPGRAAPLAGHNPGLRDSHPVSSSPTRPPSVRDSHDGESDR